jgi:hypothetical protein
MNSYKLSDEVISQVAKLIQLAILTGTDIVDNLRMLRLTGNDDVLELDTEYSKNFEENLNKMITEAKDQDSNEGNG